MEILDKEVLEKPTFNKEIEVIIPKDMPEIEHNLNELKNFTNDLERYYAKLIFTDEQIDEAKEEKKKINSLIETVKRLRIDNVKRYKEPIENFETTAKEIEKGLKGAIDNIQVYIDKAEDKRKLEKKVKIIEPIINTAISNAFVKGYLINKDDIMEDSRWYNKTFKDDDIESDVENQINEFIRQEDELNKGIEIIKRFNHPNQDVYIERFKHTRNLENVLDEISISLKKNKEVVDKKINDISMFDNTPQQTLKTLTMTFKGSQSQMMQLCNYAEQLGIEIIKEEIL